MVAEKGIFFKKYRKMKNVFRIKGKFKKMFLTKYF